ncbi:hypothetical protein QA601_09050 [Chitinispirillales bacterium ANBcel5]|uniref:hypothetical protein n=1 Tax=Cellulosispirillum alkaliphilum TaxID=3039283 RepID=UPI002A52820A|nr:hypothetical protein [Chitinispirillales bacterium ANBcel5]
MHKRTPEEDADVVIYLNSQNEIKDAGISKESMEKQIAYYKRKCKTSNKKLPKRKK